MRCVLVFITAISTVMPTLSMIAEKISSQAVKGAHVIPI